jgi:hypothetical protein
MTYHGHLRVKSHFRRRHTVRMLRLSSQSRTASIARLDVYRLEN